MAQMKARQAIDKSRNFVKPTIYIPRVVYMVQMKARQTLDKSRDSDKTTIYIPLVVYTA